MSGNLISAELRLAGRLDARFFALLEALEVARLDPSITGLVLTGNGQSFCSGGDLAEFGTFEDPASAHLARTRYSPALVLDEITARLGTACQAVVHGQVLGSGLEMAAFCGQVTCHQDATLGLPELALGLIPGAGGTQRLPRAVGKAKAMDLALTGRMMDAVEAERAGLVSRVVPLEKLMDEALGAALTIADFSQLAVMAAKESINRAFESGLADGVMFERRLFHALFATEDQKEGMTAFVEKRKAQFKHQ